MFIFAVIKNIRQSENNKMRIVTTILLIFTLNFVYGQKQTNQSDSLVINKKFVELFDSIHILQSQLQELKNKQEWKNEILNQRLEQASETISSQSSLLSGFGILYTIITIVIALIGVALPILTYQFGIRPSKEALKEFKINADNIIKSYLKETRQKQISQSIEDLKGDNTEKQAQAISFLAVTQHEGFNDQELFEFYRLIKSGKVNSQFTNTIAYLLSSKTNQYADEIFSDTELLKLDAIKHSAFQYFIKAGVKNYIQPLKKFLENNENQRNDFFMLLALSGDESSQIVILNSNELVDTLTSETLKNLNRTMTNLLQTMKLPNGKYTTTYFYRKIESTNS